ncbi:MAG: hypothetical protein AAFN79_08095 [Pseudomonadota bacterium]
MTGGGMEEGLNSTLNAPAHRSAAFQGVMLFAIICMAAFVAALSFPLSEVSIASILLGGSLVGAAAGYGLTCSLDKMSQRRRALFERELQAEREREFQRKLAEAKARGEVK